MFDKIEHWIVLGAALVGLYMAYQYLTAPKAKANGLPANSVTEEGVWSL